MQRNALDSETMASDRDDRLPVLSGFVPASESVMHGFFREPLHFKFNYWFPLLLGPVAKCRVHCSVTVQCCIFDFFLPAFDKTQPPVGSHVVESWQRPVGVRVSLGADSDDLLDQWFISESTFWAGREVDRLVREAPAMGWQAIIALLKAATGEEALVDIGCGPLEDLIRRFPSETIVPTEQLADMDARFRPSLRCVWLTLKDVPEPLARRYWTASGGELAVLDAPAGWASRADGV